MRWKFPNRRNILQVSVLSICRGIDCRLPALIGAGLGFLWFNCFPAKVFMGDTGSLSIAHDWCRAICCKQELLLVVVGGVFRDRSGLRDFAGDEFKLTGKRISSCLPFIITLN